MNSLVFSNMMHRPARTIVSVVGIGVGILLIIFTVGLANGSLRERAKREANVGAEIMVRASGSLGLSGSESSRLPETLAAGIEKVEGVASAVALAQNTVTVDDSNTGSRLVDGIDFEKYAAIAGLQIVKGRAPALTGDEVICDAAWATQKGLQIGSSMPLYDRSFTLVGIYEPAAGARIKVPLATMQKQLGTEGKVSAVLVKVKDGQSPDAIAEAIQAKFPDNQILLTSQLEELYMQGFPALNVFLDVVIGVAGVIAALIILLTMYTTVTERTRQIGVLKSLGMSNFNIAWTIVQESLLISIGGIAFGLIATYLLSLALERWSTLIVQIEPRVIVGILIVGILAGIVGALYPGLKAARLDAVEALNFD